MPSPRDSLRKTQAAPFETEDWSWTDGDGGEVIPLRSDADLEAEVDAAGRLTVPRVCRLVVGAFGIIAIVSSAASLLTGFFGYEPSEWITSFRLALLATAIGITGRTPQLVKGLGRWRHAVVGLAALLYVGAAGAEVVHLAKPGPLPQTARWIMPEPLSPHVLLAGVAVPIQHVAGTGAWAVGWGGESLYALDGTELHRLSAPIDRVLPCGTGFLVVWGGGWLARFSRGAKRKISGTYPVFGVPEAGVCDSSDAYLAFNPPGAGGYVVRRPLAQLDGATITSIGATLGAMGQRFRQVFVAVVPSGEIVRVGGDVQPPGVAFRGIPEAEQLVASETGLVALEGGRACLRPIDFDRIGQVGGVLLPTPARAAVEGPATLGILDGDGRTVRTVTHDTLAPAGVVGLPGHLRASEIVRLDNGFGAFDPATHRMALVPDAVLAGQRAPRWAAASARCV